MKTVVINQNDANQRLDKFLIKTFENLPKSSIYKYIRKKRIKINNQRCDASYMLKQDDILTLYINDEFLSKNIDLDFLKASNKIDVVYEDENILIINKPVGLLVHEDDKEKVDTLINRVKKYLYDKREYIPSEESSFSPALVNRIDRNTQGLVVAAKNADSLRILSQKFRDREVKKFYLCLIEGIPKNKKDLLTSYLIKDKAKNRAAIYERSLDKAKKIVTRYEIKESYKNFSLAEIELMTGRTHQIRAHMAHIGHPLVCDLKYSGKRQKGQSEYQALISYKLSFCFSSDSGILNYLNNRSFGIKNAKEILLENYIT